MGDTKNRAVRRRVARALSLLSLAVLLGACQSQPQSAFVRAAPVPAGMLFAYTGRGQQDNFADALIGARPV